MIDKSTVLVLGAGASIDFKFPSGWELLGRIVGSMPQNARAAILGNSCSPEKIDSFIKALRLSGTTSVDQFLATRADLVEIGKLAIAASLIPHENPYNIHRFDAGDLNSPPHWLRQLGNRLDAPRDQWGKNRLSIVTFNYDRVVEYYLLSSLIHRYDIPEDEAALLLRETITIIHVHGLLGDVPGLGDGAIRTFTPGVTPELVKIAADGIFILHEGKKDSKEFTQARDLLSVAEEIVFMGFGYGSTNVDRLGLPSTIGKRSRVVASTIGMLPHEQDRVVALLGGEGRVDRLSDSLATMLRSHSVLGY